MNLHAFRMFHTVVELGSVTKAAERLHLSQPAVTGQVRNLERELGLSLLRPSGRGIVATAEGRRLAERASVLFALERDIEREAGHLRDGAVGSLRIAATSLPANMLLPRWITDWKRRYPDVDVTLTTSNAQSACERVLHYEADLAVVGGGRTPPDGLVETPLLEDEIGFIVDRAHPLAGRTVPLATLLREQFVTREPGSAGQDLLADLCRANALQLPRVALQCSGAAETIKAVAAGCGVALASALESQDGLDNGTLARVEVTGLRLANSITLLTRTNGTQPPITEHFAAHVLDAVRAGH